MPDVPDVLKLWAAYERARERSRLWQAGHTEGEVATILARQFPHMNKEQMNDED